MEIVSTPKPWGSFTTFIKNEPGTVKILHISKGEAFSLQYHHSREEFWKILEGNPVVTVGEKEIKAAPGDEFTVPEETKHRISAPDNNVMVLEIARGTFDEEDIVRIEDKYGRN
jgi:mannose-1-phosphate guanylyltransferase/mannose-1-phosphate guanylyltransferase/mannose-6-phosphate isomerase